MSAEVEQLIRWRDDGTLERLGEAADNRTPVVIRRSSGALQNAIIASSCGFGGLLCVVAFADDISKVSFTRSCDKVYPGPGTMLKSVDTADIVSLNEFLQVQS